jgi:hypothetical protein
MAKTLDGKTVVKVMTDTDHEAWVLGDSLNPPRSHGKEIGAIIEKHTGLTYENSTWTPIGSGIEASGIATFVLK